MLRAPPSPPPLPFQAQGGLPAGFKRRRSRLGRKRQDGRLGGAALGHWEGGGRNHVFEKTVARVRLWGRVWKGGLLSSGRGGEGERGGRGEQGAWWLGLRSDERGCGRLGGGGERRWGRRSPCWVGMVVVGGGGVSSKTSKQHHAPLGGETAPSYLLLLLLGEQQDPWLRRRQGRHGPACVILCTVWVGGLWSEWEESVGRHREEEL